MQITTAEFKEEIKKPSRSFECRITIGDLIFTNEDIVDIKFDGNIQPQEGFIIGATTSTTLDLVLLNSEEHIYSTNQIKAEIGLKIGSKIEYILMGYYNIDDIEKTDYTTKFTAYDNMIKFETPYFSKLGNTATLQQIVNELATITGVEFTGSLPVYNLKKLEGFTCREILSFVASICGGNALITREGKFTIVYPKDINYELTTDNYFEYKKEEVLYKVGKVSCQVGENIISKGSLGSNSMGLEFENPWITESILTDIYNKLKNFSYLGYSMKWQGDISLDIGDIITVTDTKGVVSKLPVLSQSFTYTGGLTSEISAQGESKNKNSFSSNGNMNNKVNRVVTELLIVNEALINKANIQDLQATNAEIQNLKASNAEIENALIKFATIEQLNATNANIQNLIAEDARINNLIANKADITELNAVQGNITSLNSQIANIQTLVNGNLSSENIQAGAITGDRLNMDTIFVKDANMINVNISALKAGDISTNKFRIVSDDGGIEIVGATQQFKDKNNKVRIQMGKDTKGDFNFILRGEDGSTVLIDHTGIKEQAVADNLIKENMISANAIGEKAIDYNSFTTGFNKDTNTTTIKGTKVRLDNQNQTLDVAFTSLKNQSDNTKSTVESHTTELNIQQGKISTLIADTTITKDGKTVKLKDDYNSTVATVNSMKNTINSHTTKIDANTGKITGVESKTNLLERDLNSMSSTITDVKYSVDNLSIDNTNLIPDTDFTKDRKSKYKAWGTGTELSYSKDLVIEGNTIKSHILVKNAKDPTVTGGNVGLSTPKIVGGLVAGKEYTLSFVAMSRGYTPYLDYCFILSNEDGVANSRIVNEETKVNINAYGKTNLVTTIRFKPTKSYPNASILIGKVKQALPSSDKYHGFGIWNIILTQGNKIVAWHPANVDITADIEETSSKVSGIKQDINEITQRVGNVETTTQSHTATINAHTNSLNAVDGKINTAKAQALNDSKAFTNAEITKVNTTINSKFAEIKTTTDSINLQVSDTRKEVEKVNVKVDNIKVGIRNLIPDTDFTKDRKSKYKAWGTATVIEYSKEPTLAGVKRPSHLYVRNTKPIEDNGAFGLVTPKILGGLVAGKEYTLSFKALSRGNTSHLNYMYIMSNETGVANEIFVSEGNKVEINPYNKADKISYVTFKPKKDYPNASILIARTDKIVAETTFNAFGIWDIILTEGNKVNDWVAAPEEVNNNIVEVTTEKVNEAKADIKITTDSIKQSVSNVESSTATLNGEVTSIKSRVQTAEQKLTATSIINSVNEALSNGSNIKGMATELTKDYFRVKNTNNSARIDLSNGNISTYSPSGRNCLDIIGQNIQFYDFEKGTNKVGAIASLKNTNGKWDIGVFPKLAGQKVALGLENASGTITHKLTVNRDTGIELNDNIDALAGNLKTGNINQDNRSRTVTIDNLQIHSNWLSSIISSGWLRFNMGSGSKVVINAGNDNLDDYGTCRAGSWETVNKSIQLANTKDIGSYYTSSIEDTISDIGHGIIGENGESIIVFEDEFLSFADTNTAYFISYEILGRNRNPVYTVEHNPNYFIVGGEPGQEFSYRIECKKLGDNCMRYYREFESNTEVVNEGLDDIEGIITDNKEEQKRAGLVDYIMDMSGMQQLKVKENIEELKENNRAMQMLSILEKVRYESGE